MKKRRRFVLANIVLGCVVTSFSCTAIAQNLTAETVLAYSQQTSAVTANTVKTVKAEKRTATQSDPVAKIVNHHALLVHTVYTDTILATVALQDGIASFAQNPSELGLAKARTLWLAAREIYGQSEAFRFYGGPIDSATGPEGRINAWPIDEAYIDSVVGKPNAGLINNKSFVINKKNLSAMNERGGEENIATGWHAIEFLLWGQDTSATGPGDRSFEDFVNNKRPNAERRRSYLKVATSLLLDDLNSLASAWEPTKNNNYRAMFVKQQQEALRKIFLGLGSLSRGELAGERLEVALNSRDQEDEHSCFSDNTHRDVVANAVGIQNVWLGQYKRLDGTQLTGPSLQSLVAATDSTLAAKLTAQVELSVNAAQNIPAPFDAAIASAKDSPSRAKIQDTIKSLIIQSELLVQAAGSIGLKNLNLVRPK